MSPFNSKGIGRRDDCSHEDCDGPDCRKCPAFKPYPLFEVDVTVKVERTYRVRAHDTEEAQDMVIDGHQDVMFLKERDDDDVMDVDSVVKVDESGPNSPENSTPLPGFEAVKASQLEEKPK